MSFVYTPPTSGIESLHDIFRQLHAWREQNQEPTALARNVETRRRLVAEADPARWLQAGQRVEDFSVDEVDGARLTLSGLLKQGPLVLVFFRFAGCPACNLALPYYQRNLLPGLRALGATLLALSPQVPEKLVEIKRRHELGFLVATDRDNALGRRFGILYEAGGAIAETTGANTPELPQPTVVVIGTDGHARFVDVHPDWLLRTEADTVLDAVRALQPVAA